MNPSLEIENNLRKIHSNDIKQLECIFSKSNRLIIEAPAGYGKTKTIVSKIAFLLSSNIIPNKKKILSLTFSVNAAHKIKKEINEQLPILLNSKNSDRNYTNEKLLVTNYHGLCLKILKSHGEIIDKKLTNIKNLTFIDDSKNSLLALGFKTSDISIITDLNNSIKNRNYKFFTENYKKYVEIMKESFLSNDYITYNSIIIFTLFILKENNNIKKYYQSYYPCIIVDEFQDTNLLSWYFLENLISEKTLVIFTGDPIQRIYSFIGAIPDLINIASRKFNMEIIILENNYRFKDNLLMLQLERNIRLNAKNPLSPDIKGIAEIPLYHLNNQLEESIWIIENIKKIILDNNSKEIKIAILIKQRNENSEFITKTFTDNKIEYFDNLIRDNDSDYTEFHNLCYTKFENYSQSQRLSLKKFYNEIDEHYNKVHKNKAIDSLLHLLNVFIDRLRQDNSINSEEKISLIKETFKHKNLKDNLEHIQHKIIISTIHGAKGLEWDYVFIPDLESLSIPSSVGLCNQCQYQKNNCKLEINEKNREKFLDELNIFYVGVTRAKKQVFFSASKKNVNNYESNVSCFLKLPGIKIQQEA